MKNIKIPLMILLFCVVLNGVEYPEPLEVQIITYEFEPVFLKRDNKQKTVGIYSALNFEKIWEVEIPGMNYFTKVYFNRGGTKIIHLYPNNTIRELSDNIIEVYSQERPPIFYQARDAVDELTFIQPIDPMNKTGMHWMQYVTYENWVHDKFEVVLWDPSTAVFSTDKKSAEIRYGRREPILESLKDNIWIILTFCFAALSLGLWIKRNG